MLRMTGGIYSHPAALVASRDGPLMETVPPSPEILRYAQDDRGRDGTDRRWGTVIEFIIIAVVYWSDEAV